MTAPLQGLKVLELASVLAGPAAGMFLAELGAEVVKIESTLTDGDVTRQWRRPQEAAGDISSYFACVNWGKRSLALNLQRPEGVQLLHRLAAQADLVLSSYKPGDDAKLGADAETLQALNPRLIYAHITGYGPEDPRAGYDAVMQAECGFAYLNGEPGGLPLKMPVAMIDLLAAHQIKEAVLLALLLRERTGRGEYVQVSLFQSGVASLANQATQWLATGEVPQPLGSEHPTIAPYGTLYPCADGCPLLLAVGTDRQFAGLCQVLGKPELAQDERFSTNATRVHHRQELNEALAPLIRAWDRDALIETLAQRFVPAGAINDMPAVFAQPAARQLMLHHEASVGLRTCAFTLGGTFLERPLEPPPHFGEHSAAILQQWLDCSADTVRELAGGGIVSLHNPGKSL